ncbi:SURF1 family protein [Thalassococcus sp. CAU 1522]|uniref:SURF1-like protein n=1 Tax=Thalassococcus arenae TaxID=2851652 RepID=A0ABS6NCB5_9RHOB|nr:SURF1 family protein [Thalassococcus arenae]MBV2361671.1 SURF1 family protein [Thalassococcus arenae]
MSRLAAPLLIGLIGAAILIALGTWQVQRLAWKESVLAEIDARIGGAPEPLPVLVSPADQKYQPVVLQGTIGEDALFVLVSRKQVGPGWRVVSPFATADGRRILIDRGWIPHDARDAPRRAGAAEITGNLHWPDDRRDATPENDVAGNIWYARDIGAMAEALDTKPLLVVVRSTTPADDGVTPLPVDSSGIPNDHLQYAITWFALAAVWLTMTGVWIRRRLTETD